MKAVGSMANRQIARDLEVSPSTIDRHISRMGRHALLFHQRMLEGVQPPSAIVVDGFESFELSQYFPMHHNLAVEKGTDFLIYFNDSPLRRKGRMTAYQKKRRQELEEQLGVPDPKAIEKDMTELIRETLRGAASAVVYSDDHRAYPRAIKKVDCLIQQVITPGKQHRDKHNKLWAVNLLDLIIRHSSSNHKRETIAWSKRRQSSAERLAILLVWRNYMKGRSEKTRWSPSPAMERGMLERRLKYEDVFGERIFRSHIELPPRWAEYYDREVETRALPVNRRHELSYAY
jgi:hypothetical protein